MYKIGAVLLFMFMMITSLAGLVSSILINYYLVSSMALSYAMSWLVSGAILVSSLSSLKKKSSLWSILFLIIMTAFLSTNLFLFYIFFELSLIPILLMILLWGSQPERLSAGLYFLIYTSMVSMPYILIIMMLNNVSFTASKVLISAPLLSFILLLPFLVKMPVFGLHFWLPKAHVEASTSGSMILAGVLLKLGSYGVYRVISCLLQLLFLLTSSFWLMIAILSSMVTFMQTDVKKLVAYSSVTHMTFLMISLSISNKLFYLNCLLMSLAHGWVSMGMFFHAGASSNNSGTRLSLLSLNEGKFHWMSILLGMLLIMNAALPPFPSFFTELLSLTSSLSINTVPLFFILYSLLVCYYNTYFFMWSAHSKAVEVLVPFNNQSEATISSSLSMVSLLSVMWLLLL